MADGMNESEIKLLERMTQRISRKGWKLSKSIHPNENSVNVHIIRSGSGGSLREVGKVVTNFDISKDGSEIVFRKGNQMTYNFDEVKESEKIAIAHLNTCNGEKKEDVEDMVKELLEARKKLNNPSVHLCKTQVKGFLGKQLKRTKKVESILKDETVAGMSIYGEKISEAIGGKIDTKTMTEEMMAELKLARWTDDDRYDLSKRLLHYIKERQLDLPVNYINVSMAAKMVLLSCYKADGCFNISLDKYSDIMESKMSEMKSGSSGEYSMLGIKDRKDPKFIEMFMKYLRRVHKEATRVSDTGKYISSNIRVVTCCTLFGKTETKNAKMKDGRVEEPVTRAIFNVSAFDYCRSWVAWRRITEAMKLCRIHGPGHSMFRGGDEKLKNFVYNQFPDFTTRVRDNGKVMMCDYEKFDTTFQEFMHRDCTELMQLMVDMSNLSSDDANFYKLLMAETHNANVTKLCLHPSGFLVWMLGMVASGNFRTSSDGTLGNNLYAVTSLMMEMAKTDEGGKVVIELCRAYERIRMGEKYEEVLMTLGSSFTEKLNNIVNVVLNNLLSFGDNQILSSFLYTDLGLEFNLEKISENVKIMGMKFKMSETSVTDRLDQCEFISRRIVKMPDQTLGYPRPFNSTLAKLFARPDMTTVEAILNLRCLMVDAAGIDPYVYECLKFMDNNLCMRTDPTKASELTVNQVVRNRLEMRMNTEDMELVVQLLQENCISRPVILSLSGRKSDSRIRDGLMTYRTSTSLSDAMAILENSNAKGLFLNTKMFLHWLWHTNQIGVIMPIGLNARVVQQEPQHNELSIKALASKIMMKVLAIEPNYVLSLGGVTENKHDMLNLSKIISESQ